MPVAYPAIDVPYHYEHAPRVQQGVRVEGANNWYLGARRVSSPIVILREAPAYDVPSGTKGRAWDFLPGDGWAELGAGERVPVTHRSAAAATSEVSSLRPATADIEGPAAKSPHVTGAPPQGADSEVTEEGNGSAGNDAAMEDPPLADK